MINEKTASRALSLLSNIEKYEKLEKLFDTNDVNDDDNVEKWSDEEFYCEKYFIETTTRDSSGRFVVRMPFKNGIKPVFGRCNRSRSYETCNKNSRMSIFYSAPCSVQTKHYNKITSCVQCFTEFGQWNFAERKMLTMGKIEQPSIFELALRWRKYKIAVVADIEKMYKQIILAEDQRNLLMMLWRNSSNEPIKEYQPTTVTFGVASAPYLAIRVLKKMILKFSFHWQRKRFGKISTSKIIRVELLQKKMH